MMMGIVVWAQEAVFIHIYLLMLMLGQVCSWVELPVQRRLCPIFEREVGSPDLHECFRGLTGSQRTPRFWGVIVTAKHNVDIRNYMQLGKDEFGNLKTFSYDEYFCREGMIDYIIRAEQFFNMMETHDYSETIQTLINPQFKGWSENIVKRGIMEKF